MRSWRGSRRAARERTLEEHTADRRAAELERAHRGGRERRFRRLRRIPARRSRGPVDVGHRAGRRQRHPHPAARLLQGAAAGRQPARGRRRAAARGQRVSGRAHDPGRRRSRSASSSRRPSPTSCATTAAGFGPAHVVYVRAAASRAGLCDAIFQRGAAGRAGRHRADRPAGHDLVPGGWLPRAAGRTACRSCCSRWTGPSCSMPW